MTDDEIITSVREIEAQVRRVEVAAQEAFNTRVAADVADDALQLAREELHRLRFNLLGAAPREPIPIAGPAVFEHRE